jgi:hypothetical protein
MKFPPEIFRRFLLSHTPCQVGEIMTTNKKMDFIVQDKVFLKELAYNNHLPYIQSLTIKDLCRYSHLSKRDLYEEAIKINDVKYVEWLIRNKVYPSRGLLNLAAKNGNKVLLYLFSD